MCPDKTNIIPWQHLWVFINEQCQLFPIPDLDWQRKLASTARHPLYCVPARWPSHATLESDWFDTLNTNTLDLIKPIFQGVHLPRGHKLFPMLAAARFALAALKEDNLLLFLHGYPRCRCMKYIDLASLDVTYVATNKKKVCRKVNSTEISLQKKNWKMSRFSSASFSSDTHTYLHLTQMK